MTDRRTRCRLSTLTHEPAARRFLAATLRRLPANALLGMLLAPGLCAQVQAPGSSAPDPKTVVQTLLDCADETARQVEELRGCKFMQPVHRAVLTKAELLALLTARIEKELAGGKAERMEAWLHSLALMPADRGFGEAMSKLLLAQTQGFYDPEQKSFFLIIEATAYGEMNMRMAMAHELCHALDDQFVDLQSLLSPAGRDLTKDEFFATGAVTEGSAMALQSAWMAKAKLQGAKFTAPAGIAELQRALVATLLEAPPYCLLTIGKNCVGERFFSHGQQLRGGKEEAEATFLHIARDMPRSTEQLLHPAKYWDTAQRDEPVKLANGDELVAKIEQSTGKVVVERNTLGEMVAALIAAPRQRKPNLALLGRPDYWTNPASSGWGGDALFVVGKAAVTPGQPVAEPGAVWITAWDTAQDREEFVAAVGKHRGDEPGFAVATDGKMALFAFGSARPLGEAGLQTLLAACRLTQAGNAWSR